MNTLFQLNSENNRVGIIHNPGSEESNGYPISFVIEAILQTDSYVTAAVVNVVKSLLNDVEDYDQISSNIESIVKIATPVKVTL